MLKRGPLSFTCTEISHRCQIHGEQRYAFGKKKAMIALVLKNYAKLASSRYPLKKIKIQLKKLFNCSIVKRVEHF